MTADLPTRLVMFLQQTFSSYFGRHAGGEDRPVWLDIDAVRPELRVLDRNSEVIAQELSELLDAGMPIPEYAEIDLAQQSIGSKDDAGRAWKVFHLSSAGVDIPENMAVCPETSRLVKTIPHMAQAFFSVLEPGRSVPAHCGPYLGTLRYHLALVVPDDAPPTFFLRGEPYVWAVGKSVLFDDTWEHEVINRSGGARVVLIVDILRPLPTVPHLVNWVYMFVGGRLVYGMGTIRKNVRLFREREAA